MPIDRPPDLGVRGAAFWEWAAEAFDANRSTPDSMTLVAEVARTLDRIDMLQAQVAADGPMIRGSTGQPVLHPAIGEERMQRQTLIRLLAQLGITAEADEPPADNVVRLPGPLGETSRKAQHAAGYRWGRGKRGA